MKKKIPWNLNSNIFSFVDSNATGPAINKYRGMIEPQNTPFKPNGHGLGPIKRLWMFLVRQECIQNFFIKFIFGRKAKPVNFRYLSKSTKRRVEQPPWDLCILPVVLLYYHGYNRGIMYYLENIQHSVFFLVYYFLILLFFTGVWILMYCMSQHLL